MGNTDKFEMIANNYDTAERIQIAKISSKAIREYLVETKDKALDTSQDMINQAKKKLSHDNIQNADTLCFDFEKNGNESF